MCQDKLMQISRTIRPGQRLATRPEQNFAHREVTNCVKPEGWRMIGHNASEGIEPRNRVSRRWAKGFFSRKPAAPHAERRVCGAGPGSKSMAGHLTVHRGTWESRVAPAVEYQREASNKPQKQGGGAVAWQSDQLIVEA